MMDGMRFFQGGPDDLMRLLKSMSGGGDEDGSVLCGCGQVHRPEREVKLDAADIAANQLLNSRHDLLKQEYDRARSKLSSDADRQWADLKDKHKLHGHSCLKIEIERGVIVVMK
jgi:hypothetical protein